VAELPIACDRDALTGEERRRHFDELGRALEARAKHAREIADGFEFEFPSDADTLQLLSEWAARERRCCPFFEIEIYPDVHSASRWLRLRGREGVKEFIRTEFGSWFPKPR
jgi:hypothetical protein